MNNKGKSELSRLALFALTAGGPMSVGIMNDLVRDFFGVARPEISVRQEEFLEPACALAVEEPEESELEEESFDPVFEAA